MPQIGLSSQNMNLKVTFLTTPTEEPKLNHWFSTQLNQLVIQFKPFNRCFEKVTFKFIFFLNIYNSDLNLLILIKTSSWGAKRRYSQQLKWSYNWQDTLIRNAIYKFSQNLFSKHRPSGPMLFISQNVCLSVCVCVCLSVHFWSTV